jgi:hypothetical protein
MNLIRKTSLILLSFVLTAQTTSTEVVGAVYDSSGAAVSGAEVTLTRVETGETRRARTTAEGLYSFPLIEPGQYSVNVQMPGFKATAVTGINVQLQQRARVDVVLDVGELSQRVEVTAEARLLNTEDAAVGQSIESKRVVDVPVAYRNVGHLAVMVPGVSFGTRMGRTTGATGRTSPSGTAVSLVAHGQTDQTQSLTLDGHRRERAALQHDDVNALPGRNRGISSADRSLFGRVWTRRRRPGANRDEIRNQCLSRQPL